MHICRLALGAALATLLLPAAHADRPLVSETADVIGAGECQVEAWTLRSRSRGEPRSRESVVLGSCGVAGRHQFGLAWAHEKSADERGRSYTLVGKTTLRMPSSGRTGFGLAYALGFDKPGGQGLRRESGTVLGVATHDFDGVLLHANLGWLHQRSSGQNSTTWALGVERGDELVLAADVYGDDRSSPWVSAGAGWAWLDKLSFNAAYAQQLDRKRARQLSMGVKLQF